MTKRVISIIGLLVISLVLVAMPVMASTITGALYKGNVTITNTATAATNVSVPFTLSTAQMITDGYINGTFTNTSIQINNADTAYMPGWDANPWITFTPSISAGNNINAKLYVGGPAMDGKLRYFPDTAGVTTNDADALELGSNFEYEVSGYVSVSSDNTINYIINKSEAFKLLTYNNYLISAIGVSSEDNSWAYGANWFAQTFTPATTFTTDKVMLQLQKASSPGGNFVVRIRATDGGGLPTVTDLTTGSVTCASITTQGWYTVPITSYTFTAGTKYAIVISAASGNASNFIAAHKFGNYYTGGNAVSSTNSGVTWTADTTRDFSFMVGNIVFGFGTRTISHPLTSADAVVKVTADATNLKLYVDGTEEDSIALDAATVPNNANNYICFANDSMPYVNYQKITVGGTLQQHIAWQYAATLTDQSGQGNNPASVSFRTTSSDEDVSAALTSFEPASLSNATVTPGTAVELIQSPDLPDVADFPQMFDEGQTGGLIFDDLINPALAESAIPQAVFWYPIAFFIAILAGFIVYGATQQLLAQALTSGVVMACFCGGGVLGDGLIPYWTVIVFAIEAGMILIMQEHQKV